MLSIRGLLYFGSCCALLPVEWAFLSGSAIASPLALSASSPPYSVSAYTASLPATLDFTTVYLVPEFYQPPFESPPYSPGATPAIDQPDSALDTTAPVLDLGVYTYPEVVPVLSLDTVTTFDSQSPTAPDKIGPEVIGTPYQYTVSTEDDPLVPPVAQHSIFWSPPTTVESTLEPTLGGTVPVVTTFPPVEFQPIDVPTSLPVEVLTPIPIDPLPPSCMPQPIEQWYPGIEELSAYSGIYAGERSFQYDGVDVNWTESLPEPAARVEVAAPQHDEVPYELGLDFDGSAFCEPTSAIALTFRSPGRYLVKVTGFSGSSLVYMVSVGVFTVDAPAAGLLQPFLSAEYKIPASDVYTINSEKEPTYDCARQAFAAKRIAITDVKNRAAVVDAVTNAYKAKNKGYEGKDEVAVSWFAFGHGLPDSMSISENYSIFGDSANTRLLAQPLRGMVEDVMLFSCSVAKLPTKKDEDNWDKRKHLLPYFADELGKSNGTFQRSVTVKGYDADLDCVSASPLRWPVRNAYLGVPAAAKLKSVTSK